MTSEPDSRLGRKLVRLAVVGAVAVGAPFAVAGTADAASSSTWDKLAKCESGGNWKINTGNGYYGGLQFSPRTWRAFGGKGMPHQASKGEQIRVAERVLAKQGWKAWPSCSRKLGLRGRDRPPDQAEPTHSSVPSANSWCFQTGSRRSTSSTSSAQAANASFR